VLGYQLFDMLVWSNGWKEDHILRKEVARTSPGSPLPPKLGTMIRSLDDWTTIIPAVQDLGSTVAKQKKAKLLPDAGSSDHALQWTLSNLLHISKEKNQVVWHKILMNVYAMAFVIRWFSPVSFSV